MADQMKLIELEAETVNEETIVMKNTKDLAELYDNIKKEIDVILSWDDGDKKLSKVLITTGLLSKVKDKSIQLLAVQQTDKKKVEAKK